jgi:hypothetical protein
VVQKIQKKGRVSSKKARVSPENTMCECPKKDVSVCPIPCLSGNGFTLLYIEHRSRSQATTSVVRDSAQPSLDR